MANDNTGALVLGALGILGIAAYAVTRKPAGPPNNLWAFVYLKPDKSRTNFGLDMTATQANERRAAAIEKAKLQAKADTIAGAGKADGYYYLVEEIYRQSDRAITDWTELWASPKMGA